MYKKRIIAIMLVFLISLTACGKKDDGIIRITIFIKQISSII